MPRVPAQPYQEPLEAIRAMCGSCAMGTHPLLGAAGRGWGAASPGREDKVTSNPTTRGTPCPSHPPLKTTGATAFPTGTLLSCA